jgi:hypothetical protein
VTHESRLLRHLTRTNTHSVVQKVADTAIFNVGTQLLLYLLTMRAACILLSLIVGAAALPDGAPVCVIGNPNVNNRHLLVERKPKTGTITAGGFDVFINDELIRIIPGNKNIFGFLAGKNNTITVKSTTGQQFRGVLALLSLNRTPETNTKANLQPTGNYEFALGCEKLPHQGISHSEPAWKKEFPMTLFWNQSGDTFNFDINVVVANNASSSIYYWSQYKLKAVTGRRAKPCTILRLITGRC